MTQKQLADRLNTRRPEEQRAPNRDDKPARAPEQKNQGSIIQDAIAAIATAAAEKAAADSKQAQEQIDELRAETAAKIAEVSRPIINEIHIGEMPIVKMTGKQHAAFPIILRAAIATKHNGGIMLVGPAGSGKTTLARQIADAMNLQFYFQGRADSEYKLLGFIDAHGNYQDTPLRKAYQHGGVFLFDEMDASEPAAMIALNTALANSQADFPDGIIDKHPDFIAIAAANTFGRGATMQYVGRNQLDAATLDRFGIFDINYDAGIERALAPPGAVYDKWYSLVSTARDAAINSKLQVIISPRATQLGGAMIAAGIPISQVIAAVIIKGANDSESAIITDAIDKPAREITKMLTKELPKMPPEMLAKFQAIGGEVISGDDENDNDNEGDDDGEE
ncbi:MAG: AAA family ATPase [Pseudohongiellaceae bacterium]